MVAFAAGLGGLALVAPGPAALPEQRVAGRPVQVPSDGYASSSSCRACHPGQYASWHGSYHRTMTQVATPETVAASFDGVIVDNVPGSPMLLEQRGRRLSAVFDDPDDEVKGLAPESDSARPRRIDRQVVMTTGSHNQQIYWYATGNSRVLGQLPAIWLTADRRWIPRRAAVMHPPGQSPMSETGSWNGVCVACHTTNGQPQLDTPFGSQPILTQVADTRAAEFGISCEACHGPGEPHLHANRSPLRRYVLHLIGRGDSTVVQPMRLNPRLSSQVCGQCHSFWEFSNPQSERRANAHGLPYRPGDELAETRFIVQPTKNLGSPAMQAFLAADPGFIRDIFWSDGMVRATGREYNGMIDSPCYRNATTDARTMSCFSCHTMHKTSDDARMIGEWADDQLAPRAVGNQACLQCHARTIQDVTAHTHHRADSAGSSCYNCHMPYTTYGLLKTIRSHQISSPSVRATVDTGRPDACNLCHLDKTLAWTADYLEKWYATAKPRLGDEEQSVAASLLWLLSGDAGQRAIVAQSLGWAPAQQASGTGWIAPYLALFLDDPYDAVRYIASRSLKTLPGFQAFAFDYVAPQTTRAAQRIQAMQIWRATRDGRIPGRAQLLINADGSFNAEVINRLSRERNNRRVVYRE